jgi:ATP-dependent protease HslVU (ClpYQ) peptidase subunit
VTVIAANLREMAGDSRVTVGSVFYASDKVFQIGKSLVGVAGDANLTTKWLAWFRRECPADEVGMTLDDDHTFNAIVLNSGGLFVYGDCTEPDKLHDKHFAIGVGADIAMAAMALGKTPTEAVKLACRLDPMHCGLPVKTLSLHPGPTKPRRSRSAPTIRTAHDNPTSGGDGGSKDSQQA